MSERDGHFTTQGLTPVDEFYRSVVGSSRDCIKVLGLDGSLLMMTEGGRHMLRIEDLAAYIGKSWIDFWQGDDQVAARIAVKMAAAGGVGSFIGMSPRSDGEPRWWDVLITPIRDASETATRLLAVSRDVTDRKRSELNAALLASLTDEISWLTDASQVLQTVGARIGAHLNLTSCVFVEVDEISRIVEVTHEWRWDSVRPTLGKHRMQDYFTEDFQKTCHAGETFVVADTGADSRTDTEQFAAVDIRSFISVPMVRGGLWHFSLSVHRSIPHEWRKDEIELVNELTPRVLAHLERVRAEETSARLAAIVEFSDDAIISKDLNGIITTWNKGAEKVFGYTASEAIGRPVTMLMPPGRTSEEEGVLERIRRGESIAPYETVRRLKDGRLIDIALTVSPIVNARGEVVGASKIARDITVKKQNEEALVASETRFRTAVNIVSSIVWTSDAAGKMTGEQPGWEQFTGQPMDQYEGEGWFSAVHPEDAQPTLDAWQQAVEERRMFEFEHRVRRHDGEWRWCSVRAVPVPGDDGEIRDWVGVHHDITQRKRANLDVALLDSISEDLLRISGMDSLMRTLGEKLGEHLGLSRCVFADVDEAADKAIVVHDWLRDPGPSLCGTYPLSAHLAPEFSRAALAGEPLIVRDGTTDPRVDPAKLAELKVGSFISLPFVRNSQLSFLLSIHHSEPHDWREDEIDLMREVAARLWARLERSRAEDALARAMAESEQQRRLYHTVLSNTPDFIYVFDLNHRFSYINDALLKVYGMTWEEAKGKDWIGLGYEAWHAEMHDREIDQVIATKAPIRGEIPFTGTTGTRIYDYIFSPVFDKNGEVEAIAGTTRDITERKQAEAVLAEQAAEALRSDRLKDEFLAMLAHELRNPLAPIRNATEILHQPGASAAAQERARQLIARQTENMSRMIDDLLDVSRITEGKIELRKQTVELGTVLTAAAEVVRQTCDANGQTLTVSLPDHPLYLAADATRLEQLFGNLLGNACKYSGAGSHIQLSAEVVDGRDVDVRVADNGIGIDPELLPRIFDLFVQASRTLDRSHGGLGIGLTIVDRLVRLHGGTIEAHSEGLQKGSAFVVRLPLCEAPLEAATAPAAAESLAAALRMLIVDDNEDAAESMAMFQEIQGHETRTAHNGPEAMTLAAQFVPQVVLLDIGLPGMDGFEVARRMRALPQMKDAFLIALTGYGTASDRKRAKEAGFDEHLAKPADMRQLDEWLKQVQSQRDLQGSLDH